MNDTKHLNSSPTNAARLASSIAEFRAGETKTRPLAVDPDAPLAPVTLTAEQRAAIEWAAGRAHVEALGKPIAGVEGRRWRVLSDLFRASAGAPAAAAPMLMAPEGEDPMRYGDRKLEDSVKRLRAAYCVQQPLPIPDQMALVWRFDIGRLYHDWIRLNAWQKEVVSKRDDSAAQPEDRATAEDPPRLTDADIDTVAQSMPGGLDSFKKLWGWRQFARAIEDEVLRSTATQAAKGDERAAWPMLAPLHLEAIMFAYNEGWQKAYDGREFANPFAETGSQAAAWEAGTRDGKERRELHARSAVSQASEWQPIETASKDGTPILMFARYIHATTSIVVVGAWFDGEGWINQAFSGSPSQLVVPSHWMPRPAFPKTPAKLSTEKVDKPVHSASDAAPVFEGRHVSLKQRGTKLVLTLELDSIEGAPRYALSPINPAVVRAGGDDAND